MKIKVTDPNGNSQRFSLPEERDYRFSVGRGADCHIVLGGDDAVSRCHAFLEYKQGYWYVVDNQSTNGVVVEDRLVASAPLHPGRRVLIGSTVLEVLPAAPAPVPPPAEAPVASSFYLPPVPQPVAAESPAVQAPESGLPAAEPSRPAVAEDSFADLPTFETEGSSEEPPPLPDWFIQKK